MAKEDEEDEVMTITVEENEASTLSNTNDVLDTLEELQTELSSHLVAAESTSKGEQETSPSEDSDEGVVILLVDRKKSEEEVNHMMRQHTSIF